MVLPKANNILQQKELTTRGSMQAREVFLDLPIQGGVSLLPNM